MGCARCPRWTSCAALPQDCARALRPRFAFAACRRGPLAGARVLCTRGRFLLDFRPPEILRCVCARGKRPVKKGKPGPAWGGGGLCCCRRSPGLAGKGESRAAAGLIGPRCGCVSGSALAPARRGPRVRSFPAKNAPFSGRFCMVIISPAGLLGKRESAFST